MLRWPDLAKVRGAVEGWAARAVDDRPEVLAVVYFGSYARGDWGVGSDLDVLVVVEHSDRPFTMRAATWDTTGLPVPTDLLVYTRQEWDALDPSSRFVRMLVNEGVWLVDPHGVRQRRPPSPPAG